MVKHKVFISHHHANDQLYKEALVKFGEENDIFIDGSVDIGDIDDSLDDQAIRAKIRDEYLQDSTVTILLVGMETKERKHIDWELYSSMIDGAVNKRSGIIVVHLPNVANPRYATAPHAIEKDIIHSDTQNWVAITSRAEYERRYPYLPARIIDNLLNPKAKISVVNWDHINVRNLSLLIENAYMHKESNEYDLSRSMRRQNG